MIMTWLILVLQLVALLRTVQNNETLRLEWSTLPEENRENRKLCLIEGDIICDLYGMLLKVAPLDRSRLWTNRVVPYTLDSSYNNKERRIISEALDEIERKSCLRFKSLETENDYLSIERTSGCFSHVGRTGGAQVISLNSRCFLNGVGTVIHELLHALGFWHEQNRYDRDEYVKINIYNVLPGLDINFQKIPQEISDLQGLEYDYSSILHYGRKTFAADTSQDTITPLDPKYMDVIGQRKGLSDLDVKRLNMYYKCDILHCEEPPDLANGYRRGSDFSVGQTVNFDCEEGYTLVGSREAFCRFDGAWSGLPPSCNRLYIGYDCNFTSDLCGWVQDYKDDFDWTRINGGTPSLDTGPMVDHTTETSAGHYIYIETSEPMEEGQVARIISPTLNIEYLDNKEVCLTVCYHMWGQDIGSLNVYIRYYNKKDVVVWSKNSESVPEWRIIKLSFKTDIPVQVVFEGVVGPGSKGDIALDDVVFEGCQDNSDYEIVDVDTPDPPDPWQGSDQSLFQCDFENSLCGTFDNEQGEFDWLRNQGPTGSYATGPSVDHTLGTRDGIYLYLETSHPRIEGDKSNFVLPALEGPGEKCLLFHYHMYGEDMGSIRVILKQSGENQILWQETGNKGDLWREAKVVFTVVTDEYQIIFEGVCGPGTKGDAAIDDIAVFDEECSM